MNIAEMWDICIKFMWDKTYVNGLDKFLKSKKVKTILDCGGGTGFPSINLKKMGGDISYCDNDKTMINHFQNKTKNQNLNIPTFWSDWSDLSNNIDEKFDAILCRGNSLIYVNSWNVEKVKLNKENIKKAMQEFFKILNENGLVYIDVINKKEFDKEQYPIIEEFGERTVDGKKVKVTWELTHNYKNKIRTWKSIVIIDGKKHEFVNYSYLLRNEELVKLMEEVGFKDVKEVQIDDEKNYNVFVGHK